MQVILKRNWFVGGTCYRRVRKSAVEIPDKYRSQLPKDAVEVGRPEVPVEDALEKKPEVVSGSMFQEDPKEVSYVNPAHAQDPDRAFAEAFSQVNEDAKSDVDSLRDKIKNPNQGN